MIHTNRPSITLLIALALGWSVDFLFYGKALGVSALVFVLLLIVALFGLGRLEGVHPAWRNLWLLAPLIFFAAMVFVRANPTLTFFNVVAILALLGFVAHFYAAGRVDEMGLLGYPFLLLLWMWVNVMVQAGPLVKDGLDWKSSRERSRGLMPLVRGLLLALPVLVVFSWLLASADLVFADYLRRLLRLEFLPSLGEWFIILGAAWLIGGGLVYALGHASKNESSVEKAIGALAPVSILGTTEAATVLVAVDILFGVFVWIQFAYLFGGQANITLEGYTYSDYARRGFFELLAVSVLSLALVLSLHWLARRETSRQERTFNALSSLMVALVLVILTSAFQRLLLYEAAYGYTQLRLYSHVFMVWLAITFAWFLVSLWLRLGRFAIGAFVAALGFLITLNAINPDAFIAEQNLARYWNSGNLDVAYLTGLSADAVPVLVSAADQLAGDRQKTLRDHLRQRLERMEKDARWWQGWPSFHLARWRAYELLAEKLY
jgi:hypothetical protein